MPDEKIPGKAGPEMHRPTSGKAAAKPTVGSEGRPASATPTGSPPATAPATPTPQANNPLHGLTLEAILSTLVEKYGWEGLAGRIPVKCFMSDPSLKSSLTFLRRTPWAREKVEKLYLGRLRRGR